MALIQVSYEVMENDHFLGVIINGFDKIEEVKDDPLHKTVTLRVTHAEVPVEDKIICPEIYAFPGIKPFFISYDTL